MKYTLYICLVFFLVSCSKELPYPDVENEDFMVLNGLISPETGATVHLSQSCHILDTQCRQKNIENAQVFLKDETGNTLTELKHTSGGIYLAEGFQIDYNKEYSIEASSSGLESITAKAFTPKPISCKVISNDEEIYEEYLCRTFEIEIADNPDETNYYLIDGWLDILNGEHESYQFEINGYNFPHTGFVSRDVNAENGTLVSTVDIIPYPLEFVFLTDENFNGKTYQVEFGMYDEDVSFKKDLELATHLNVKSVSKDMYEYYRSISLHKLTAANILGEPQPIFSNVEKGVGILGGYSEQQFVVDIPNTEFWFFGDFSFENGGCTGPCTVKFKAEMGEKVNFIWDFGDGTTSTERSPEHEYQTAGNYIVTLSITRGDGIDSSSQEILIN